jgi:beta-phosphoglucomutase-like phosphatase (HAD superfamily)
MVAGRAAEYQRFVEDAVASCPMVAGAEAFLREHAGTYRMHLVSGTPDGELRRIVEARGLAGCFASIAGSPPGKKDSFARILARDAIGADEAVAIGDSRTEHDAADALGIAFIGVVALGQDNPFPQHVPVLPDLSDLAAAIAGHPAHHHRDAAHTPAAPSLDHWLQAMMEDGRIPKAPERPADLSGAGAGGLERRLGAAAAGTGPAGPARAPAGGDPL